MTRDDFRLSLAQDRRDLAAAARDPLDEWPEWDGPEVILDDDVTAEAEDRAYEAMRDRRIEDAALRHVVEAHDRILRASEREAS